MLVIFDCDGVLVDSETLCAQVLTEHLQRLGIAASEQETLERYRGKSFVDCVADLERRLALLTEQVPLAERRAYAENFWRTMQADTLAACRERLQPIAGVAPVLARLHSLGVNFCVASNGQHEKMAVTLEVTGLLPYVQGRIFSVADVVRGKPAPDLFLHAARTMGYEPQRALVVEDSPTGVRAAVAAGMASFGYCPPGSPLETEMRSLGARCFSRMDELLPLLWENGVRRK